MFIHTKKQTVDNKRKLHREMLHEITSAYRRTGRSRGF